MTAQDLENGAAKSGTAGDLDGNRRHSRVPRPQAAIRAELIANDCCSALGMTARGPAPVLSLCRQLIEAGHDPATPLEAWRGDVLCLRVRSIGKGARLTVEDDRLGQPRFRRWRDRHAGDGAASSMLQNEAAGTLLPHPR
jgi:hypothetical protein